MSDAPEHLLPGSSTVLRQLEDLGLYVLLVWPEPDAIAQAVPVQTLCCWSGTRSVLCGFFGLVHLASP